MRQRTQLALVAITTLAIAAGGVVTAIVLDDSAQSTDQASNAQAFTAPETTPPSVTDAPVPATSPTAPGPTTSSASPATTAPATTRPVAAPGVTRAPVTPTTQDPAAVAPPAAVATVLPVAAQAAPISYTVKPGDTLSDIAAWFALNGYTGLYEANWAVIGSNPDLIRPGQVFTIVGGQLQMPQG